MSWAKLDDGFWMHPKVLIAGNAGAGIFARLLSYCGCYLTDGLIPEPIANQIVGSDKKALGALVNYGMVEVTETGSLYIPEYLEHNRSKADVESDRRQRIAAGKASALARRGGNDHA